MLVCKNCGARVEQGDLFCHNCGSKQDYGTQENVNQEARSLLNQSNKGLNCNFNHLKDVITMMIIKPIDSAKIYVENVNKETAFVFGIILCLIQGFLGMWKTAQIIENLNKTIINFLNYIANVSTLFGKQIPETDFLELTDIINKLKQFMQIPYGTVFYQNFVVIFVLIISVFIVLYIFSNILSKSKKDGIIIFKISTIIFLPIIYSQILSIIFSYISFYAGMGMILFGIIISIITMSALVRTYLIEDENKGVFIVPIIVLINFIVTLIFVSKFTRSNILWLINHIKDLSNIVNF